MFYRVDVYVLFFKQKTAYEMRISDWSSDVCSSDLSVSSHLPKRLRTALNIAAASSWVIGSGRNAGAAVSTGCKASMASLHMALYIPLVAIWQYVSQLLAMPREDTRSACRRQEPSCQIGEDRGKSTEERRVGKEWVST